MKLFTLLADWVTINIFALDKTTGLGKSIHFFIEDITKIFLLLFTVIFFVGVIRYRLSPEKVKVWLEKRSTVSSHFLAVLFGSITPFCSCSSVPLFIGFIEAGIPLGATMSFLITSPMINEVAVILLLSLLGVRLTLLYVAIGLAVGFMGGMTIHFLKLEHLVEDFVYRVKSKELPEKPESHTMKEELKQSMTFGFQQVKEIVGRIWIYVMAGVALGAVIHGYVPQKFLIQYAGSSSPLAVPFAVLMGVPLYSNVSGTIPVAEALLGKGIPAGTVIALMMSISALSLPEMLILRKVLKPKLIGIFIAILSSSFIAIGYLMNIFY